MTEEDRLQCACVRWYKYCRNGVIAHVPNGGSRNAIEGAKLKSMGVLAGFADLIIIEQDVIMFVELKTQKGRQSDSQRCFQQRVTDLGFQYFVARSLDEFIKIVKENGKK